VREARQEARVPDPWLLLPPLLGPFVGSFVGLLTVRMPAERPVLLGRSACGACGRTLGPVDLVPLLSFAALGGRCRTCRAPIPRRYPLIEGSCLLIGLWAALVLSGPQALLAAAFGCWLLALAVIDAEHFWLPDALTLPLLLAGLAAALAFDPFWTDRLIGAVAGWTALAGLGLAYRRLRGREGLGGGDPRLFGAIGAWVGWQGLPSVLLIAACVGIVWALVLGRGRPRADLRLPFGTCLAVGAWLTYLYGPIGLAGR
jgi:leader peptidase (prepilin peptidase)/N-methyltransferase